MTRTIGLKLENILTDEQPMAQTSKQTKGLISQLQRGCVARGPSHTAQCKSALGTRFRVMERLRLDRGGAP